VSELSQTKELFSLPLSPCKRASYPLHFIATFFPDKNDQNASLASSKAMIISESFAIMVLTLLPQILHLYSTLISIMSRSATNGRNPSKRTQWGNDSGFAAASSFPANGSPIGGGSATPSGAAGNTTQAGSTSPLKAALVLKVNFIELLPNASRLFLTPLVESALHKFAYFFYAEGKAKEVKSDPSYILSSVKKLGIILQAMPEVQESQGFKTLRNNLTSDLEEICAMIMQNYVLKANDMNIKAQRERYRAVICKWIHGLAQAFIMQQGVNNYNEGITRMDLIASAQDGILVPLGITLPNF
jgi:hypothetical protein